MQKRLMALLMALVLLVPQLAEAGLWLCRADGTVHTECCCKADGDDPMITDGRCCDRIAFEDDDFVPLVALAPAPARWNLVGAVPPTGTDESDRPRTADAPLALSRGPPVYLVNASFLL